MKVKKLFAGMAAAALALTMTTAAFASDEGESTAGYSYGDLKMYGDEPLWENKELELTVAEANGGLQATVMVPFDFKTWEEFEAAFGENYAVFSVWKDGSIDVIQQLDAQVYVQENPGWGWSSKYGNFALEEGLARPVIRLEGKAADLAVKKAEDNQLGACGIQYVAKISNEANIKAGDTVKITTDLALFSDAGTGEEEETGDGHSHDGLTMVGNKEKWTGKEIELEVGAPDADGNLKAKGTVEFDYDSWEKFETEFGTKFCAAFEISEAPQDLVDSDSFDAQVFVMDNAAWAWKSIYGTFKIDGGKAQTTITTPSLHLNGDTATLTAGKTAENGLGKSGVEFVANIPAGSNYKQGDIIKIKVNYALFSDGKEYVEPETPAKEPEKTDDNTPPATGAAAGALALVALVGGAVVVSKKRG